MVKFYRPRAPGASRTIATTANKSAINKRRTNAPVKKALTVKKVTKSVPTTNKNAIMVLSKQVRKLQMEKYGEKQQQHQHISSLTTDESVQLRPSTQHPYAFCVNNLYNDAPIMYGTINSLVPTYAINRKFSNVEAPQDIGSIYLFNHKQQEDTVSNGHFMPIKSTLKFTIRHTSGPNFVPVRIRFTIFKVKQIEGNVQAKMPQNLGAYRNMCSDDPKLRNHFNTNKHHIVLQDKWVTLRTTDVVKNHNLRTITMPVYFPPKLLEPEITSTNPSGQDFNTNIPYKEQIWCLVSSNLSLTDSNAAELDIYCERWNTWRDATGTGS